MFPNNSRFPLEVVAETVDSSASVQTVAKRTEDKDVTVSSSIIDLFNFMNTSGDLLVPEAAAPGTAKACNHVGRGLTEPRREKPRQHRIKVRSPKRHQLVKTEVSSRSFACAAIDWSHELVTNIATASVSTTPALVTVEDSVSEHSLDDMCRICHGGESLSLELGPLISACNCRGTVGRVHVRCLERWLTESGKSRCELCGARYCTRRVHRYGVPRALLMWLLSQNAKQLMVDSLGVMLMCPLAVLAAWLSGRTLAGLVAQDRHAAPWPLASTFVLACMTLACEKRLGISKEKLPPDRKTPLRRASKNLGEVCYYCWIVSAATRHALGWWIWYRSQYEVRLLLQDAED